MTNDEKLALLQSIDVAQFTKALLDSRDVDLDPESVWKDAWLKFLEAFEFRRAIEAKILVHGVAPEVAVQLTLTGMHHGFWLALEAQ